MLMNLAKLGSCQGGNEYLCQEFSGNRESFGVSEPRFSSMLSVNMSIYSGIWLVRQYSAKVIQL